MGADTKANTRELVREVGGLLERLQRRVALETLCNRGSSLRTKLAALETAGWGWRCGWSLPFCQHPLTLLSTCLYPYPRSLARNELGPEGGAALAEGLKGNSTLQSLE